MRCPKCNTELDQNGTCPACGYQQSQNENVQAMSGREADSYSGITIEDEGNYKKESTYRETQENKTYRQTYSRPGGVRVHYMRLGGRSSNSGWLTKGLLALGGAAVLAFFFFIALPVLLTLLGAGIVAWIIFRFFRR